MRGRGRGGKFDGVESEVRCFREGGGVKGGFGGGDLLFVLVEVHNFLLACSDRSLAVRTMGVEGCSESHSSVESPVREIPRWTFPPTC